MATQRARRPTTRGACAAGYEQKDDAACCAASDAYDAEDYEEADTDALYCGKSSAAAAAAE